MRSSKWIPIALSTLAICSGCAKREPVVWVDLSRVPSDVELPGFFSRVPSKDYRTGPQSFGIPGVAPSMRGKESAEGRREGALALMEREFLELQNELEENYRRVVLVEAEAEVNSIRRSLSGAIRARADAAMEQISQVVRDRTPNRARMIVRAALLVGWPTVRGYSEEELSRSRLLREWSSEGRELHAKIREDEAETDRRIEAILAQVRELNLGEGVRIESEVRAILSRADSRAAEMVRDRLRETNRAALPPLLDSNRLSLEPQPPEELHVEAVDASMAESQTFIRDEQRNGVLAAKLDIFLRVRGYKLAAGPHFGPDKTAEFTSWLRNP